MTTEATTIETTTTDATAMDTTPADTTVTETTTADATATDTAPPLDVEDALARSTAQLSRDLRVRTILVISRSGRTAAVMSASRTPAPIVPTSPQAGTCRLATLLWGVIPVVVDSSELDDTQALARRLVRELGFGVEGQKLLVVRGFGTDPARDTPSIAVVTI